MNNNIENIYPLTPLQKGILYHNIVEEKSNAYFEQMEFEITGKIDIDCMEKALNYVVAKHEIFRTAFVFKETREPKQVVLKDRKSSLEFHDLSAGQKTKAELEALINEFKTNDRNRSFDLLEDCLIRMSIFRMNEDTYRMILSFQHIILDGWSIGIFFKELLSCYKLFLNDGVMEKSKNNDFSGYISWLNQLDKTHAEEYWKDYVSGYDHKIKIGEELGSFNQRTHIPEMIQMELGAELTEAVSCMAKELRVPPNTIYEAAWGILLSKFNSTNDAVFGKIVSGRNLGYHNIEDTIGLFINTIPKRIRYDSNTTVRELVKEAGISNYKSSEFEYLELNQIQNYTDIKKDLVNHLFVYENYPIDHAFKEMEDRSIGFDIQYLDSFEQTNYDLAVVIAPADNTSVIFRYNAQVLKKKFLTKVLKHYINCISKLTMGLDEKITHMDIIIEEERSKILNEFNNTASDYPRDASLYDIFKRTALANPQKCALKYGETKMSYTELLRAVSGCASELSLRSIKKGDRVGLLLDNSMEMMACILGILAVGASYVPIDRTLPDARIRYIIQDSGIALLIYQEGKEHNQEIVPSTSLQEIVRKSKEPAPILTCNGDDEACIVYTSGTTGYPKGTLITNRNISRVVLNTNYVEIRETDIMLQASNYSFDGSFFNIFGALLNGATLVLLKKEALLDMKDLSAVITSEKITLFFMTTSLFNVMVTTIGESLKAVRCIVIGGEAASAKHCKKALEYMDQGTVINGYGPTESTVFATAYVMKSIKDTSGKIPIGNVISNTYVYIVDSNDHLQPIGVEGEICIAGDGIVKGYLHNDELTDEKFVADSFKGGILYRTGDVGRWRENGIIEYCGRKDSQVKIRGYRVELEELENHVNKNKKLKAAAAIAIKNDLNMNELALFYTSDEEVDKNELRGWLKQLIPSYMVPKYFIQLEEFQLNKNGKIDKGVLNRYEINKKDNTSEMDEACEMSDTEQKIMDAWKSVLLVDHIGLNDDFYEIGGDSIKAILVYTKLQKDGLVLSMKDIVKYTTMKDLAHRLDMAQSGADECSESRITLLNDEMDQKIILFPAFLPKFANQIMGKLLLEHIEGYSIYIAEFFETDNLYSEYADMLTDVIRPEDHIVFMGYSFGGNIAYEVAKELEGRGIIIKNLIFIDSYRLNKFWFADPSDLKIEVDKFFDEYVPMNSNVDMEEFQSEMFHQMSTYCNFINNYVGVYPEIEASMHMILSSEEVIDHDVRVQWELSTKNKYQMYQGYGTHMEMWRNDFLSKNLELLSTILNTI